MVKVKKKISIASKIFDLRAYIKYKLLNSLFLGVSIGVIFTIYSPLTPSTYSIGGVALALGLLFIAKIYNKIINIKSFFFISLSIEIVMVLLLFIFLIFQLSYSSALSIYIGYQVIFMFGGYLIRVETVFFNKRALLSIVDVSKQKGYLLGMIISFSFYKFLEYLKIEKEYQVFYIHYLLIAIQISIIFYLLKGFRKINNNSS